MNNQLPPESSLFPDPDNRPQQFYQAAQPNTARLWIYVIFAAIIAISVTLYFGFKDNPAPAEPVIVQAEAEPVKERPEQPGGVDIPYQDITLYDKISKGGAETERKVERLLPPEEISAEKPAVENVPDAVKEKEVVAEPAPQPAPTPAPVTAVEEKKVEEKKIAAPEKTEAKVEKPAPPAAAKPTEKTIESIIAAEGIGQKGSTRIQLAAFPDEAAARAEMGRLQKKYAGILGETKLILQRADLGSKGTYFRIQSPGLTTARAEKICSEIKVVKGGCLIAK
jgi:outer membrane biosynthesis protein TonB